VYVCNDFQVFSGFFQVFQKNVSSVSSIFFFMLQVLHLDVLKVDRTSVVDLRLLMWIRFLTMFLDSTAVSGGRPRALQQWSMTA
jgi:hypothetical protein